MNLQKLNKEQIKQAAIIFAKAMMNDDVHLSFFPNKQNRLRKLTHLYEYKLGLEFKSCYITSSNLEGLAIWETPGEQHAGLNLKEIVFGIKLIWQCGIGSLIKMIRYQNWALKIRDRIASHPYWYLNVIVVDPDYQGKGFASTLIKPVIEEAIREKQIVYLETQNKNNVKIYKKYGFRLVDEIVIPKTSVMHYCMINDNHLTTAST